MSSAKTFGILAIILALAGFGIWYVTSLPKPPTTLNIQKVNNPDSSVTTPNTSGEFYKMTVPKGGWYDTGKWVRPWNEVMALSTGQPAELKVGTTVNTARLMKVGIFNASIVTTDALRGNDYGYFKQESTYRELAPVGDQDKIYLKVNDEAATDQLDVTVAITPIRNEDIPNYRKIRQPPQQTESWAWQHKGALISVILVGTVCFVLGIIIGRVST